MKSVNSPQGFRWPVAFEKTIAAPAIEVWAAISMPGNLEACHPFCAENSVLTWPGAGSRDEIRYLSGLVYERRFFHWIDGVGYDLEIGKRGGRTATVSWRITPVDNKRCRLRITVFPDVLQGVPILLRWLPHIVWLRPRLRSYLRSVVDGFEWYVCRGVAVPRNQFGTHPWFSARETTTT